MANTENGKAFEYACVLALYNAFRESEDVVILGNSAIDIARNNYETMPEDKQATLLKSAEAGVRIIRRLEPQLEYPQGNKPLYLAIQADAEGIKGDVRDVLCVRRQNGWEIGLSCKHNHHAVKHSRLSASINFGKDWVGIPCSKEYFDTVCPIFNELKQIKTDAREHNSKALWSDIPDKAERYYKPILTAFMNELRRLADENKEVPAKLIHYLMGKYDFYKVITDDSHQITTVEAVNIAGTLNKPSGNKRSIVNIPMLRLPTYIYHIGMKPGSDNTVIVALDEGWQISMRIHNAKSEVEPSLKFDIQLVSLPNSIHSQIEPW